MAIAVNLWVRAAQYHSHTATPLPTVESLPTSQLVDPYHIMAMRQTGSCAICQASRRIGTGRRSRWFSYMSCATSRDSTGVLMPTGVGDS